MNTDMVELVKEGITKSLERGAVSISGVQASVMRAIEEGRSLGDFQTKVSLIDTSRTFSPHNSQETRRGMTQISLACAYELSYKRCLFTVALDRHRFFGILR